MSVDRDDLGEMREGMNPGLLTSQDFTTVDRHLWAAFEHHVKTGEPSDYCKTMMQKARATEDLAVKKMFILGLMCIHPEIKQYYEQKCPIYKFTPWFADLRNNFDTFTAGIHRDGTSKCVDMTDAKFPSLVAFVAEMTASYVNL
jgi:hypothetical protein